ncbi:MAG TPA: polymer-forming cytoskeletal protein [Rhizomicrobium sp.]
MSAMAEHALIRTHARRGENGLAASRIGNGLTVTGALETDGELHVHGRVLGTLRADRLVLAADGEVEGDIVARDVRICGRLNGRVFALNVMLDSTADIKGRVFHHTMEVARGARVDARMPWRPLNFFETLEQLPETQP